MPIHKVVAKNTSEGLKKVFDEYGGDALILKTVKRGGQVELFVEAEQKQVVEPQSDRDMMATTDAFDAMESEPDQHIRDEYREARLKMLSSVAEKADNRALASFQETLHAAKSPQPLGSPQRKESPQPMGSPQRKESPQPIESPQPSSRRKIKPELTVSALLDMLELTPGIAARLRGVKRIDEVTTQLSAMLPTVSTIEQGIFAFVGSSGSGKTTSLIKLLVQHVMQHGEDSCAIINCDHYRMGAKEQLTKLGELIGVDVLHTNESLSLNQAIANVHRRRLVLIDTPGLGRDSNELKQEMFQLSSSHYEIQRLMVVPANLQFSAMQQVRKTFASQRLTSCVITRMDETQSYGALLSFLAQTQLPASYVSNGPKIPEDLNPANAADLVRDAMKLIDGEFAKAPMSDLTNRQRTKKASRHFSSQRDESAADGYRVQQQKVADL